jgi:hypothetical protein
VLIRELVFAVVSPAASSYVITTSFPLLSSISVGYIGAWLQRIQFTGMQTMGGGGAIMLDVVNESHGFRSDCYLRTKPGQRTDGHNVFLYHHPARRDMPMDVDFGVEVVRTFEPEGEVRAVETPAGEAAVAVHVGSYDRMKETHDAIHAWSAANKRAFAGKSWEIYGDWSDDPAKLETTIVYLLK